jgi:hypothetical protein
MKRLLLAVGIATVVFGGVFGLAASLGVNTQTLGAGNTAVAACQSTALTTAYATVYDSTVPGYEVTTITVTGLDTTSPTNCANKPYKITLTNSSNASLGEVSGTTPASGTSFITSTMAGSNILAANATGIHLTITG